MRRTKEEAEITRATILKTALSVFSAKGYSAATLDDVAKAAKVTRGAIYWHFKNKADLYNTLVREFSARGAAVVQQAVAEGGTLVEILRRIFVRQCALIEDDKEARAVMELALFKTDLSPELQPGRKKQLEAGNALVDGIATAMQQGIAQGALRNDISSVDMARAFLSFENGAIQMWLASPKSFSLRASAGSFADILIAGLQNKGKPLVVQPEISLPKAN
ncbi:MAG TPA: TetR family transcriptional regulator [Anaerolineales bacterium]|nr:TetR family transcriptional regulator [Anaerolineales bacterium]